MLFLNGGYGVGKSATLDHVGDVLAEAHQPFSLMDVDWFHRSWPPHPDDPDNVVIEADNLAAVWTSYRRAGPRQLVVAGVLSSPDDRRRYERALALPLRSVRLTASPEVTGARLRQRYTEDRGAALRWHLDRYDERAAVIERADLDELVVDTDHRRPRAVAEQVLRQVGLVPRIP